MRKRRGRGEGSIEELPGGSYRAVVAGGTDPVTGKRIKLTYTAGTKKEVLDWLRERLKEKSEGRLAQAGKITVCEWLDRWVTMRKSDSADSTSTQYEGHVRLHLKPVLGAVRLADLKPLAVADAYRRLEEVGVSAAMRFKVATTLRTALKSAVDVGLIHSNPALKIKKPKVEKPKADSWTTAEVKLFLASFPASDVRGKAMCFLALDAGLRQGELLGLHWSEVDLVSGAVQVVRSLSEVNGEFKLKEVKRDSSRRRIKITPQTVQAMESLRGLEEGVGRDAGRGPVFVGRTGGWLSKTGAGNRFRRRIRTAKVRRIRFHDMRHTMATLLLLNGVNVKAVSARLGHASIQITLDTYAHVLPQMEDQIVNTLTSVFG